MGSFRLEMRDGLQLEQIRHMLVIDERFGFGVIANASTDVFVQHGIGKTEVVFVALVGKAVRRGLLHQLDGQA